MIIFYDGNCPLCTTEMQQLKSADTKKQIILEDLNAVGFSDRYAHVDKDRAMNYLQAQNSSGEMIYGLDVTYQAWKIVGKHRWLKILRLPVIRFFADQVYVLFAKYRQPISRLLMPNATCSKGQCGIKKKGEK
jgi:predicted DCC family thiol-disulfide oxidoreductase YuxK